MSGIFDTGIRPAIDAFLQAQREEVRDYGDYWSASSAGYCMRRNIFERLKVPHTTEDARKQRVFSAGHIFHDWIQGITKAAGLSIAQELELQDEELMIRGHIDDLVLVDELGDIGENMKVLNSKGQSIKSSRLILYDYKTQNSRAFSYKRPMSYYHKMQLATYMHMLRQLMSEPVIPAELDQLPDLTEARILKISKDDLRMTEEVLFWSEELSSEVRDYWTKLNNWWTEKKLPPCTCADQEGGFMAQEKWNPYWYEGEPCSVNHYNKWKEEKHARN